MKDADRQIRFNPALRKAMIEVSEMLAGYNSEGFHKDMSCKHFVYFNTRYLKFKL
jgi:hypothetical protein